MIPYQLMLKNLEYETDCPDWHFQVEFLYLGQDLDAPKLTCKAPQMPLNGANKLVLPGTVVFHQHVISCGGRRDKSAMASIIQKSTQLLYKYDKFAGMLQPH